MPRDYSDEQCEFKKMAVGLQWKGEVSHLKTQLHIDNVIVVSIHKKKKEKEKKKYKPQVI